MLIVILVHNIRTSRRYVNLYLLSTIRKVQFTIEALPMNNHMGELNAKFGSPGFLALQ